MNKEITLYKLIGLMKNGEEPIKIKYQGKVWDYNYDFDDYKCKNINLLQHIFSNNTTGILNELVEIIDEENDEFEDIEELKPTKTSDPQYPTLLIEKYDYSQKYLADKFNQLIRNQKKIIERLNKDE